MSFGGTTRVCLAGASLLYALGCQSLERFDTNGKAAYCGQVVASKFVLTSDQVGGFDRQLRLQLKLDMAALTSTPGSLTSDDAADGPCHPSATFANSKLVVTQEIPFDPLSTMTFEDGQVHNIVAWVDSSCRGKMLAVVSLYKTNHVEVRLLKPSADSTSPSTRDAFALFPLDRYEHGCEF